MLRLARALSRALRGISRRLGRTGGTTAPGRVLLRLSPGALGPMAAELDDGLLDVLSMVTHSKVRFLTRTLPGVFKGALPDAPESRVFRGAVVEVDADRPFVVYADGDPIARTPVTMRVRQRCLRMMVPA